jgi:hypothetical protein
VKTPLLFVLALSVAGGACNRASETETVESKVKTEVDASGQSIETESEVAGRIPGQGEVNIETKTYLGDVTEYTAGKSLKVKMSDGETQSFDLDDDDVRAVVETSVKVGSKVEVVVEKEKGKPTHIMVAPHA